MNKYALGTIVGTALVGLAKARIGSQLKLKVGYICSTIVRVELTNIQDNDGSEENVDDILERLHALQQYQRLTHGWEIGYVNYRSMFRGIIQRKIQQTGHFGISTKIGITVVIPRSVDPNVHENELYKIITRSANKELEPFGFKTVPFGWEDAAKASLLLDQNCKNGVSIQQDGEWVPYKKPETTLPKLRMR
jgi:hypothetical protein